MRKVLLLSIPLLFTGCATRQEINTTSMDTAARSVIVADQTRYKRALQTEVLCGREHVAEVDDGTSDATTIALALALRCNTEYDEAVDAAADALLDNEAQRRAFKMKSRTEQHRVEMFLPTVMQYRHLKNKVTAPHSTL